MNIDLQKKRNNIPVVLFVTLLIISLGLFIFARFAISAKGLEQYIIDPATLSNDAKILYEGEEIIEDISHPLGLGTTADGILKSPSSEKEQPLYEYTTAYSFSALLPNEGVVIADFTYQYGTQADAQIAAKIYGESLLTAGFEPYELSTSKDGQSYTIAGTEGDYVSWFIEARDDVLMLVLVNGMNQDIVNKVFESVAENMPEK